MISKTIREETERLKEIYQKYSGRNIDSSHLAEALTIIRLLSEKVCERYESVNELYDRLEARDDYVIKHLERALELVDPCDCETATYIGLALNEIKNT